MQAGPVGQWYFADPNGTIVMDVPLGLDAAGGGGTGEYPMWDSIFDFDAGGDYSGGGGDTSGGWLGAVFGSQPGSGINVQLPGGGGGSTPSLSQTLTQLVNAAESALKGNLGAWQAQQIGAADAIARAWAILNDVVARCAAYGAEGLKAAAERDRRINPAQLRWDWIAYYIDPINGGPTPAQPLPSTVTPAGSSYPGGTVPGGMATAGIGGIPSDWLLIGAAVAGLLYLSKRR